MPIIHGVGNEQLTRRIDKAKTMASTLFLSLHHDSVQAQFLRQWTVDGKANYYSDVFSGFSIFINDASQNSSSNLAFARRLADAMIARNFKPSLHHAMKIPGEARTLIDERRGIYANDHLAVLRETSATAVLLEAGIIVNRKEEMKLQAPKIRSAIGQAIVEAVQQSFCVER